MTRQMDAPAVVESSRDTLSAGGGDGTSAPGEPLIYRERWHGGYRVYLPDHSNFIGTIRRMYVSADDGARRWVGQPAWGAPELPPCKTKPEAARALRDAWHRAHVELPVDEEDWEHDDLCRAVVPS